MSRRFKEVKILKHGFRRTLKPIARRCECVNCGCLFEYSDQDIKIEWYYENGDGRKLGDGNLCCPECGVKLIVSDVFGFEIKEHA